MIDLGHATNAINKRVILENENPNKIVNIVEKIFDFNKQQKGKGIDILTHKHVININSKKCFKDCQWYLHK